MRKFGDRKDGRRVRDLTGMAQISIDLKPNRCDSDVYINQKMDLTELVKYVNRKKSEGMELTYFPTFVTAIGKTFYNRPRLNYFVANRHVFEHNEVVISFVAKVTFDDKSEQMMIMIPIEPSDTLETISNKIKEKVSRIRSKEDKKEGANNAIDTLGKLPNIIRVPLMGIFKWLDQKGKLPASLVKDNLYYSSIIVSNLGSIKCGAIYHNINDFGTCSSLATMGEIKKEEVITSDGRRELRDLCEFGINFDERVADGYYFAKSIKYIQYIFDHPELLEERADTPINIEENKEKIIKEKKVSRINPELKEYVEKEIFPEYEKNKDGHDINHIVQVLKRSFNLSKQLENINLDMVYTIAAFHDIGYHINKEEHETVSANMFYENEKMKDFFTEEERVIIKEAIEDHRFSSDTEPRSIYGKLIASADKTPDLKAMVTRTRAYSLKHFPEMTEEEMFERERNELRNRFSKENDKCYIKDEEYEKFLDDMADITSDIGKYKEYYSRVNRNNEENKSK